MANDTTSVQGLWILDSVALLTDKQVVISKIVFIPAAAGNDLIFKTWNESSELTAGTKVGKTGTITNQNTLTCTVSGDLPSDIADGYVFEITNGTGTAVNHWVKTLVTTAGNNTVVVVNGTPWTNEATVKYNYRTFATAIAIPMKAGASDASPVTVDFGEHGKWFPNLTLETISAGTAYVYLK